MKVFIADDSILILERLREMLGSYSQVEIVGSCNNGIDALESLRNLKPDLGILDLKMPGLSGLNVLSEIRKENKTIKIIILTLFSSDTYRQMAIQSDADYFFSKADDFEKVALIVAELVKKEEMGIDDIK